MSTMQALAWCLIGLAVAAVLYGLHRLCLWLEDRGLLYYLREKPGSSGAGTFMAMQRLIEPEVTHVEQVADEKRHAVQADDNGQGPLRKT